jgi:carboxylesterase type B
MLTQNAILVVILMHPGLIDAFSGASSAGPVINTDDGPIQGDRTDKITIYKGVPFAAPPTEALRFAAPRRPTPWTVTKSTVKEGGRCAQVQLTKGVSLGQEDCLYLDVYVPTQCTAAKPCPVMQWIYGGAWITGDSNEFGLYDATRLATANGVIVVAGNYRLDVLGWLALDELQAESGGPYGNLGLQDQRAAMQWTQRNIAKFGGDPDQVTIFGESAGGFSVCQHMTSPDSNGLFSHAIIESGGCDGPWVRVWHSRSYLRLTSSQIDPPSLPRPPSPQTHACAHPLPLPLPFLRTRALARAYEHTDIPSSVEWVTRFCLSSAGHLGRRRCQALR